ncbi:MAG: RNA methyltransferase [Lachnospiraceae bacterium]|jgi:tRNA G18 (ribose-2'-O)-methylase SpoU|nr:RNA methyltransferase [Lachnospiraceae bacterium]MCI1329172.1 RNA methyltransferase [Lachnospiraceae bacterium]
MRIQIKPIIETDFSDPALSVYAETSETALLRRNEPAPGLFIAESPNVIIRALRAGYCPVSFLIEADRLGTCEPVFDELAHRREDRTIPVFSVGSAALRKLTGYPMTRGVLCAMQRRPLPSPGGLIRDSRRIAVLEDIENPTNVGAIFRSAAAMFIDAVILSPGCADPLYRRTARVSMGTVFQIPWTFAGRAERDLNGQILSPARRWPSEAIRDLKEAGFFTAALALSHDTVSIDDPALKEHERIAVLLGNESTGIRPETLRCCDVTAKIPMARGVDSLNVAAASAVAFWELSDRR